MKSWTLTVLILISTSLYAQDNETCLSCHGQKLDGIPSVNAHKISLSVHGKLLCVSCHADAADIPHAKKPGEVSCAACHRVESEIYLNSDHGRALSKGRREAATCRSCHGEIHGLLSPRNPASPVHRKNIPATCAVCHADKSKMDKFKLTEQEPFDTYLHSVHGVAFKEGNLNAAVCSDCHGTHDLHSASNQESKIYRANVPRTCGKCHENVMKVYERSIHGKAMKSGIKEVPVCTDCHGEHTIRAVKDPASSVWSGAITKTCVSCHDSAKINAKFGLPTNRIKSFQDSYHGLAGKAGDLKVANCASCHGWHDVLPSNDPNSSVNEKNLTQTCGKCHAGIQTNFIKGKIHGGKTAEQPVLIRWVKLFYLILIPLLIGGMLFHNFADYIRKAFFSSGLDAGVPPHEVSVLRMNLNERIQHGFLLTAFITLAYSGFALKHPDHWWALPFQLAGGEMLRKGIHRWTALAFVITALMHFAYMVGTRRGRFILRHRLLPKIRDVFDPFNHLLYNLGWSKSKPNLHYPSYIEKMEYWALLWGSIIMVLTGGLLVFNNITLKYLPMWVNELATLVHYYEAILACLSILVWHFYWTIFDPDVYPMNKSWLTGFLKGRRK